MFFVSATFAQKRGDLVVLKDSITGKDTVLMKISIVDEHPAKMQYAINTSSDYLGEKRLTPNDVITFRKGKKVYYSRKIKIVDNERSIFLQRIFFQHQDSLSFYLFFNEKGKSELYYQMGTKSTILPLSITDDGEKRSALSDYLLQSPIAKNNVILQNYIKIMPPTFSAYKKRAYICRTGNLNLIPSFRWGILTGGGFSQLKMKKGTSYDKQLQWYVGAFADVPLAYGGISFHPELAFQKVSALVPFADNGHHDIAYNRTNLRIPLLLRYTIAHVKGRFIPYLQAGPELNLKLSGDTKVQSYGVDNEGFAQAPTTSVECNKFFLSTVTAGVGIEYKQNLRHSFFIDLRFLQDISKDTFDFSSNGFYLTVSYNL